GLGQSGVGQGAICAPRNAINLRMPSEVARFRRPESQGRMHFRRGTLSARAGNRRIDVREKADDSLVARWHQGDQQAAAELFRRYVDRLIALARSRLSGKVAQRVDPEDVVQSVYRTFFADVRDGRYLRDRGGDMWQLLVTITLHKVNDQIRRNKSDKRDFQKEQSFSSEDSLIRM